jgi:hypothetical protein
MIARPRPQITEAKRDFLQRLAFEMALERFRPSNAIGFDVAKIGNRPFSRRRTARR